MKARGHVEHGSWDGKLGFWELFALALGGVVGSGWLMSTAAGTFKENSWNPWYLAVMWLAGGLCMLVIALVMVELGRRRPWNSGLFWWPYDTSGPHLATFVAAAILLYYSYNAVTEAIAAVQGTGWCTGSGQGVVRAFIAAGLIVFMVALNALGLRRVVRIIVAVTAVKVFVLLMVLVGASLQPPPSRPVGGVNPGWWQIAQSLVRGAVVFAYVGFQGPVDFAGRARRRGRDVRWAVLAPVLFAVAAYTALQSLSLNAGWVNLPSDPNKPSSTTPPSVYLAGHGWLFGHLIGLDSWLSPLSTGLIYSAVLIKIIEDVSRNHFIRSWFGWQPLRARRPGVAWLALAVNLGASLLILLVASVVGKAKWGDVMQSSTVMLVFIYATPAVALAALSPGRAQSRGLGAFAVGRVLPLLGFVIMTLVMCFVQWETLAVNFGLAFLVSRLVLLSRNVWLRADGKWRDGWSRAAEGYLYGFFALVIGVSALRTNGLQIGSHTALQLPWLAAAAALGVATFVQLVRCAGRFLNAYPAHPGPVEVSSEH